MTLSWYCVVRRCISLFLLLLLCTLNTSCSYYKKNIKKEFPISDNDIVINIITNDGIREEKKQVNIKDLPIDQFIERKVYKVPGDSSDTIGYNSTKPIVLNDSIFYINKKGCVYKVNKNNPRKMIWSKCIESKFIKLKNIKTSSIAINNNALYITYGTNHILSLDINNGSVLWERNVNGLIRGDILLDGIKSILITTSQNKIYSLNQLDGSLIWVSNIFPTPIKLLSSPSIQFLDNKILLTLPNKLLILINKDNGYLLRNIDFDKSYKNTNKRINDTTVKPLIVDGNHVILSTYGDSLKMVNIKTGDILWSMPIYTNSDIIVVNKKLYLIDQNNNIYSINTSNGVTNWIVGLDIPVPQDPLTFKLIDKFFGPIVVGDRLLLFSRSGHVVTIDINTGEPIGKSNLTHRIGTTPAVYNGEIYSYVTRYSTIDILSLKNKNG